ncbi:hypothetical protein NMY22_g2819 [Coprinellus aureogranulatus]|nr:hypothetical protein NMY22_g2819 [Coprinellus aureogranulatus]
MVQRVGFLHDLLDKAPAAVNSTFREGSTFKVMDGLSDRRSQVEDLKDKVIRLTEENEELKQDKRSFRSYNEHLKKDLDNVRRDLEKERKESVGLRGKLEKQTKKLKSLESQLQEAIEKGLIVVKKEEELERSEQALVRERSPSPEIIDVDSLPFSKEVDKGTKTLQRELDKERQENVLLRMKLEKETKDDVLYFRKVQELQAQVDVFLSFSHALASADSSPQQLLTAPNDTTKGQSSRRTTTPSDDLSLCVGPVNDNGTPVHDEVIPPVGADANADQNPNSRIGGEGGLTHVPQLDKDRGLLMDVGSMDVDTSTAGTPPLPTHDDALPEYPDGALNNRLPRRLPPPLGQPSTSSIFNESPPSASLTSLASLFGSGNPSVATSTAQDPETTFPVGGASVERDMQVSVSTPPSVSEDEGHALEQREEEAVEKTFGKRRHVEEAASCHPRKKFKPSASQTLTVIPISLEGALPPGKLMLEIGSVPTPSPQATNPYDRYWKRHFIPPKEMAFDLKTSARNRYLTSLPKFPLPSGANPLTVIPHSRLKYWNSSSRTRWLDATGKTFGNSSWLQMMYAHPDAYPTMPSRPGENGLLVGGRSYSDSRTIWWVEKEEKGLLVGTFSLLVYNKQTNEFRYFGDYNIVYAGRTTVLDTVVSTLLRPSHSLAPLRSLRVSLILHLRRRAHCFASDAVASHIRKHAVFTKQASSSLPASKQ